VHLKLAERVVPVTGSTAGTGLALAESIAREGAHVYVNGRTRKRVDAAVASIRSQVEGAKADGIDCGWTAEW